MYGFTGNILVRCVHLCVLVWCTDMQVFVCTVVCMCIGMEYRNASVVRLCVSVWCTDTQVLIHRFVIMKMRNESEGNR